MLVRASYLEGLYDIHTSSGQTAPSPPWVVIGGVAIVVIGLVVAVGVIVYRRPR